MTLLGALLTSLLATGAALIAVRSQRFSGATRHSILCIAVLCAPVAALLNPVLANVLPQAFSAALTATVPETTLPLPAFRDQTELGDLLFAIYAVVAGALLIRAAMGVWQANAATRKAAPLSLTEAEAQATQRNAALREGNTKRSPYTWGLLNPVIVVPPDWATWSRTKRLAVLHHELEHIRRWDVATTLFGLLACCLLWVNPLIWIAYKKQRQAAEAACDDAVIKRGTDPHDYATYLVEIAQLHQPKHWTGPAPGVSQPSTLAVRIRALLDSNTRRTNVTGLQLVTTLLTATLIILSTSAFGVSDDTIADASAATKLKACGALKPASANLKMVLSADWYDDAERPFSLSWTLGDNNDSDAVGKIPEDLVPFAQCVNSALIDTSSELS